MGFGTVLQESDLISIFLIFLNHRYESFGYTSQEMFMEWNEDNNVNANISLAQFSVFTSLVVPACFHHTSVFYCTFRKAYDSIFTTVHTFLQYSKSEIKVYVELRSVLSPCLSCF
jgi:hypothetical protein